MNDLLDILNLRIKDFQDLKVTIAPIKNEKGSGFEIKISQEYEYVDMNFEILFNLAEYFGTKKIDIDNWSSRGCDTCDYGSSYTHSIQIYDLTKNIPTIKKLTKLIDE